MVENQSDGLLPGIISQNDPSFGYCSTTEEAVNALKAFEEATSNKFVVLNKEKQFGLMDISAKNHCVMFEGKMSRDIKSTIPFCGQPFLVLSQRVYECKHGVDRHILQKKQTSLHTKHSGKIMVSNSSVKLDCPAKVVMKEVVLFPQFCIRQNNETMKKRASKKLRDALRSSAELQVEQRIYISFPAQNTHRNHALLEPEEQNPQDVLSQQIKESMLENSHNQRVPVIPMWPTYEELNKINENKKEMDNSNLRIFTTEDEVLNYIEELEIETATKYVVYQKDKHYGNKDWRPDVSHRIYWKHPASFARTFINFDGFPFMFVGRKILSCHHGPDQAQSRKRKRTLLNQNLTRHIGSKKLGCKAQIYISHIVKFPVVQISADTEKRRKLGAIKLRSYIKQNEDNVKFKTFFLVSSPSTSEHEGHLLEVSENPRKRRLKCTEELQEEYADQQTLSITNEEVPAHAESSIEDPETRRMEIMFQCDLQMDKIRELMANVSDENCLTDLLTNLKHVYSQARLFPRMDPDSANEFFVETPLSNPQNKAHENLELFKDEDTDGLAQFGEDTSSICEIHIQMDS